MNQYHITANSVEKLQSLHQQTSKKTKKHTHITSETSTSYKTQYIVDLRTEPPKQIPYYDLTGIILHF